MILRTPQGWLEFSDARCTRAAQDIGEVRPLLELASREQAAGHHVLVLLSYESAPAFDPALATQRAGTFPLAWMASFTRVASIPSLPRPRGAANLSWSCDTDLRAYQHAIRRIKDLIASGDTYQVNATMRLSAAAGDDAYALFHRLAEAQRPEFGAWIETGDFAIACASPELFFRKSGSRVTCLPMKGTARRGATLPQDRRCGASLAASEKNRAENLMIVDMVRNDLGRVATAGGVHVRSLFDVAPLPTVWQMTSTIEAETHATLWEILCALFPSASVTGAPKVRTMQIIRDLETSPRGLYTGSIGHLAPNGDMQFNVAIRTAVLDKATATWTYGTGSGVVWDSSADDEYAECMNKALILHDAEPAPDLFETILWKPDAGYWLLEEHVNRLVESATYFSIPIDPATWRDALKKVSGDWRQPMRARFTLRQDGTTHIEATAAPMPSDKPWRVRLASTPVDSLNPRLYHKTTDRRVYDVARSANPDVDDVLLWNERGELTESTVANVVVVKDGRKWTPPIHCGLLPGVFRAHLLASGQISERVINKSELGDSDELFLINSLRGWIRVELASEGT